MSKKLTFFESLFLNKRDREILLSSDETINNDEDISTENDNENINENTETSFKVLLTKNTSISNLNPDFFVKDENDELLADEEKDLILFDTIENVLGNELADDLEDALINDLINDDLIVEEIVELSVTEKTDELNPEDVDTDIELNILDSTDDLAEDLFDDLVDEINVGDTIVFNANELHNLIEDELSELEKDELVEDLELIRELKDLDSLDSDEAEIEFVSLDFGDDTADILNDATDDSDSATITSGIIHFDLDDQLEDEFLDNEYYEDVLNHVTSLDDSSDDFSLLDSILLNHDDTDIPSTPDDVDISITVKKQDNEVELDIEIEEKDDKYDEVESNFPTLDILPNEPINELSNDKSDDDEINIPMI